MKINWGHKLLIVFIAFVGLIATLVYKAVNTNFDLVTKDYYKEELKFQKVIDGQNNALELSSSVRIDVTDSQLVLHLPEEMKNANPSGNVWFYCPTDVRKDKKFDLDTKGTGSQTFDRRQFIPSRYIVKMTWEQDGKPFYMEQHITL